jgi:hypothetical protein
MPGLHGSTFVLRQSLHITVMCVALCCARMPGRRMSREPLFSHSVRPILCSRLQGKPNASACGRTAPSQLGVGSRRGGLGRQGAQGCGRALGLDAAVTMPGTMTSRDTFSDCGGTGAATQRAARVAARVCKASAAVCDGGAGVEARARLNRACSRCPEPCIP